MKSKPVNHRAAAGALLAGLLALGAQGALAQATAAQAPRPDKPLDKALYMKIFEYRLLGAGQVVDCLETSSDCEVTIDISQVTTPSGDLFCLAQLPETIKVKGTTHGGREKNKKMVWSLKLGSQIDPTKFTFRFQDKFGILVVKNPKPEQIHGYKIGTGSGTHANNPMYFHVQNRRNNKGNDAVYLPVILQTEAKPDGTKVESLCGAADPRIIND
jgi:hypothetical protein